MLTKNMILKTVALAAGALALLSCQAIYSPMNSADPVYPVSPPHIKPAGSVDDFEDGNTTNDLGGGNSKDIDPYGLGSAITVNFFAPGSTLSGGTFKRAAQMFGSLGAQVAPWPYVALILGFPGPMDLNALAPNKSVVFAYKAGPNGVNKSMNFNFNDQTILDYGWYVCTWKPTDQNWHQITFWFPGTGHPANITFAQPTWAVPHSWAVCSTNATHITILPVGGPTITTYDITIDDVRFE